MAGCSGPSYCIASRGLQAERTVADHPRLAKTPAKAFDSKVSWEGDNLLEVTDLAVTFASQEGRVQAVDGISFGIREGETVGLVGESGCGKSISALAILGLVRMMSNSTVTGKVEFMGRDLLALPEHEVRRVRGRDMSMIFQDPVTSLNPVLSIERQTTEGMENHLGLSHSDPRPPSVSTTTRTSSPAACASAS
jgi:ABC-type microcin C transport system duplicated ATPase subunit YejF